MPCSPPNLEIEIPEASQTPAMETSAIGNPCAIIRLVRRAKAGIRNPKHGSRQRTPNVGTFEDWRASCTPYDPMRQLVQAIALGLVLVGCVDPGANFDAFVERAGGPKEGGPISDGMTCAFSPGSVTGEYVLAISVTLAPTKPILSLADITSSAVDGGDDIAFSAQPLSASDRKTPVGASVALGPFPVGSDGSFRADLRGLEVTGAANPVTGGDITADVVLSGSLCGDGHFFCGSVTGSVEKPVPLNLKGSTFTLTRLDTPASLPIRPAIDCAGTLADPL